MAIHEKVLEEPFGTGMVSRADGAELGPVRYRLRAVLELHDVRAGGRAERVEGLRRVDGHLAGDHLDQLVTDGEGELRLQDGRRLKILVRDLCGSDAVIRGSGWFY
jgi:hypothetical protein